METKYGLFNVFGRCSLRKFWSCLSRDWWPSVFPDVEIPLSILEVVPKHFLVASRWYKGDWNKSVNSQFKSHKSREWQLYWNRMYEWVVFFPWFDKWFVYYEVIKRELNIKLIYECRCDERLKDKTEGSTRLGYTGLSGGLSSFPSEIRPWQTRSFSWAQMFNQNLVIKVWILSF
jgi:hypothetical protein